MVKDEIKKKLEGILAEMGVQNSEVELESSVDLKNGDYSTSIALKVAKQLGKSPMEIAEKIAKEFGNDGIEKVEAVKPGFVNFWVSQKSLLNLIENAKSQPKKLENKKIVVEYTDPNPFKELHIGHLYSNIIGESLCRIFEANGATVWRADYFGDVGMHVAKAIWGLGHADLENPSITEPVYKENLEELLDYSELVFRSIEKKPLTERIKFLGIGYALGSNMYEKSERAQEDIRHLNKLIYVAAQRMWEKEKGLKPTVDYQQGEEINEKELAVISKIYSNGRKWSLEYFETLYRRLGTKFDSYYPESIAGERGYKLVRENLERGIFKESDGAVIFPGEEYGLHTRVFINKLGLPTYEAKELGLAPWKYEDFAYDMSFIVTGMEISAYFSVLMAALKKVNPELGEKTHPLLHGMVNLPGGKMSSRKGNVITVEGLFDEAKERIKTQFTDMEEATLEQVGMGAVKYALLKSSIGKDVTFSFEESISLEGNSGPYLQYTYARTRSVLAKTQKAGVRSQELGSLEKEEEELLRILFKFSEIVGKAAEEYAPHLVCTYLFNLAQQFNLFYQKHKILGSESQELRIKITEAVGSTLKQGLHLLGIQAPEKM